MGLLSPILRNVAGGRLAWWCPGCDHAHMIQTGAGSDALYALDARHQLAVAGLCQCRACGFQAQRVGHAAGTGTNQCVDAARGHALANVAVDALPVNGPENPAAVIVPLVFTAVTFALPNWILLLAFTTAPYPMAAELVIPAAISVLAPSNVFLVSFVKVEPASLPIVTFSAAEVATRMELTPMIMLYAAPFALVSNAFDPTTMFRVEFCARYIVFVPMAMLLSPVFFCKA